MNKNSYTIVFFLFTVLVIFTIDCGALVNNKWAILGKWEKLSGISKGLTYEFLTNGKLYFETNSGIYESKYEFIDNDRLKIYAATEDPLAARVFFRMWELKIDNGKMFLKLLGDTNRGEIMIFKRKK